MYSTVSTRNSFVKEGNKTLLLLYIIYTYRINPRWIIVKNIKSEIESPSVYICYWEERREKERGGEEREGRGEELQTGITEGI